MNKKLNYGLLAAAALLALANLPAIGITFLAAAAYLHYLSIRTSLITESNRELELSGILFRFVYSLAAGAFMIVYADESIAALLLPTALVLPVVLESSVINLIQFSMPTHMVANLKVPMAKLPQVFAALLLPTSLAVILDAAALTLFDLDFATFSILILVLWVVAWIPQAFFVLGRRYLQNLRPRMFGLVMAKLNAKNPKHAFYFDGPADAIHHVTMWTKQMESLDDPYFVIVRARVNVRLIAERVKVPVVWARSLEELDELVDKVKSLKVVFYANNGARNTHMVRFNNLTHVQLLHGESDKPPSYNPITAMYDKVFVAGQGAVERYRRHGVKISDSKFEIISRPQLTELQVQTSAPTEKAKTVLYAPTWGGHFGDTDFTSIFNGVEIVNALIEQGVKIIFRPHPYSKNNPNEREEIEKIDRVLAAASTGDVKHVYGAAATTKLSINECINQSDALVSDISSVVGDYLFTNKPFAIFTGTDDFAAFESVNPLTALGYLVSGDLANLKDVLTDMLSKDSQRSKRLAGREYFLSSATTEELPGLFNEAVKKILAK